MTLFGDDIKDESIFHLGHTHITVVNARGYREGTIFFLLHLFQTGIEHTAHHGTHIVHNQFGRCAAQLGGERVVFEKDLEHRHGLLLVFVDDIDGFVVVGHGIRLVGCGVVGHLDG